MTEEDTVRILCRPDIHRMVELYQIHKIERYSVEDYSSLNNIKFAKKHGWNWLQFLREKKKAGYP